MFDYGYLPVAYYQSITGSVSFMLLKVEKSLISHSQNVTSSSETIDETQETVHATSLDALEIILTVDLYSTFLNCRTQ